MNIAKDDKKLKKIKISWTPKKTWVLIFSLVIIRWQTHEISITNIFVTMGIDSCLDILPPYESIVIILTLQERLKALMPSYKFPNFGCKWDQNNQTQ